MKYTTKNYPLWRVKAQLSHFEPPEGISEYHVMLLPEADKEDFSAQLDNLHKASEHLIASEWGNRAKVIFKRYFLSDITNQISILHRALEGETPESYSAVQQSPLNGSKVGLWLWLQTDMNISKGEMTAATHNGYSHLFSASLQSPESDSETETHTLLARYSQILHDRQCTLANNCIRTWFFVRDVDVNYGGVVEARREDFIKAGLTENTHYIASTGISGYPAAPEVNVLLDTYAVKGLESGQIQYLYAKEHLNPTYEYEVTFERGTAVTYGDRKHIFISGTASIDKHGEIVSPGDIVKQVQRTWENVEALLKEAGSDFTDMAQIIVYLRDIADYHTVQPLFDRQFPNVPKIIVLAPVCRPGWLIEMECIAVKRENNPKFRNL